MNEPVKPIGGAPLAKSLSKVFLVTLGTALLGLESARALTITLIADPSLSDNLSPTDMTNAENAFNYAAQQIARNFSDPININITMAAVSGTDILGESSTVAYVSTYADVRGALINDNMYHPSADGTTSLGNLPATDPTGTGTSFIVTRAQAKAVGMIGSDNINDGTFYFGAGNSYTYDPNNRAVTGQYDFIGMAEHEITEIMGRIQGLGVDLGNGTPDYTAYDLFRYSAPGTRGLSDGSGIYFSIDNGTTNLKTFNFANGNDSDSQDWANGTNDSFNAFTTSGVKNDMSTVDLTSMDVIGYDKIADVPEPGAVTLLAFVVLASVFRRGRHSARGQLPACG